MNFWVRRFVIVPCVGCLVTGFAFLIAQYCLQALPQSAIDWQPSTVTVTTTPIVEHSNSDSEIISLTGPWAFAFISLLGGFVAGTGALAFTIIDSIFARKMQGKTISQSEK